MMNSSDIKLCVIIPTYNNAGTVKQVIEDVSRHCEDIIVVNDGSTDNTAAILSTLKDLIQVVSYSSNKGKGHALVAGFRRAMEMGFTHAVTIDADGQHFADDMPQLIDEMYKQPDSIIVGCRNLTEQNMPRQNTFANRFSNFWFRLQTGINLPDTQSGYRLYALSALRGLRWITSRYEAELELLVFSAWKGHRITSVPVRVYYPPAEERVSHFRPIYDFVRISILNTILCIGTIFYGYPAKIARSIFSFCYFIGLAIDLNIRGFFILTLGGKTEKNKQRYHRILQRKAQFVINHVPGTTFKYFNPHGETFEKPAVIVCNHQSHLDLMAIMMLTPNLIILTKDWVWHNPFYGIIIRYADYFPVSEMEQMTQNITKKIKEGYSVMIFPEGTRSPDCHIQRFHRGAFFLAEQLQLDIIPVFIKGFGEVLPKKAFHMNPGHMTMEVMPRISRQDEAWACDYREMTKRVHRMYKAKSQQPSQHHTLIATPHS